LHVGLGCALGLVFASLIRWSSDWQAALPTWSSLVAKLPFSAFAFGLVLGFLAASAGGWIVSQRNILKSFTRFHDRIDQRGGFYPTASHLVRHVEAVPEDKIVVLIGGHSVFRGVGQNPGEEWTRALQAHLGDRFVVINYAMGSADPQEFAGVVYRSLAEKRRRLLYVAGTGPWPFGHLEGSIAYRYVTWDAYYRGWLPDAVESSLGKIAGRQIMMEGGNVLDLHLDAALNRWLGFRDFWNFVAYQSVATVFSDVAAGDMFRPRRRLPEKAYPFRETAQASANLPRESVEMGLLTEYPLRVVSVEPDGVRISERGLKSLAEEYTEAFPGDLRARVLLVICPFNPRHESFLTEREAEVNRLAFQGVQDTLQAHGFPTVTVPRGLLTSEDFLDQVHFLPSGGDKAAAWLAPIIRERAQANALIVAPP
jgi:hypothetical protein